MRRSKPGAAYASRRALFNASGVRTRATAEIDWTRTAFHQFARQRQSCRSSATAGRAAYAGACGDSLLLFRYRHRSRPSVVLPTKRKAQSLRARPISARRQRSLRRIRTPSSAVWKAPMFGSRTTTDCSMHRGRARSSMPDTKVDPCSAVTNRAALRDAQLRAAPDTGRFARHGRSFIEHNHRRCQPYSAHCTCARYCAKLRHGSGSRKALGNPRRDVVDRLQQHRSMICPG